MILFNNIESRHFGRTIISLSMEIWEIILIISFIIFCNGFWGIQIVLHETHWIKLFYKKLFESNFSLNFQIKHPVFAQIVIFQISSKIFKQTPENHNGSINKLLYKINWVLFQFRFTPLSHVNFHFRIVLSKYYFWASRQIAGELQICNFHVVWDAGGGTLRSVEQGNFPSKY